MEKLPFDLDKFREALDGCTRDGIKHTDPLAIAFSYYYDHVNRVMELARLGEATEKHVQSLEFQLSLTQEWRDKDLGELQYFRCRTTALEQCLTREQIQAVNLRVKEAWDEYKKKLAPKPAPKLKPRIVLDDRHKDCD